VTDPIVEYQPQTPPRILRRNHLLLLLAITLLGGILRFWNLSQPALWGDEAATYSRICGDYQDLIDILQFNGFVPLHYELYHWIRSGMPLWARVEHRTMKPVPVRGGFFWRAQASTKPSTHPTTKPFLVGEDPIFQDGVRMTPVVMRLVPAIAGTLMIPAMYFLAMQVSNRRTALIAAIFTAASAYMLVYSRDAKMYMHFWLFCALSVACLLWWLRVRTRIAWLSWIASSLAMCGLHAPGAVLLGIELLIFLSHDRQWWLTGAILLIGFVLSGFLHGQTRLFSARIDDRWLLCGFAFTLGAFALFFPRRRDWKRPLFFLVGLSIILSGIGGYYLKFNRFKERIEEDNWNVSMLQWVDLYNKDRTPGNLVGFPVTAYLMSWEWTQPSEEPNVDPRALKLLHGSVYAIATVLLIGLLPWRKTRDSDIATEVAMPVGRKTLWMLGWILIPAYAFYCVSMGGKSTLQKNSWTSGYTSPTSFLADTFQWMRSTPWLLPVLACLAAAVVLLSAGSWWARLTKLGSVIVALAVIYLICQGTFLLITDLNRRALANNEHWHSLWMPRYLGIVWPAFAIVVAGVLARLPKTLRVAAVALLVVINLAQFVSRLRASEPPTDRIAADMLDTASNRTYLLASFVNGWGARPGEGLYMTVAWRYYMAELCNMKLAPQDFRSNRQLFINTFKPNINETPLRIAADLKRSPQIGHIVVWDKIERSGIDANRDDLVRTQLGPAWRRMSEKTFSAFDHWTWQKLYEVRRREYVRMGH
jgi:hypothetical protein